MADNVEVSAKSIAEKLDKSDLTDDEKAALANIIGTALEAGKEVEGFLLGAGANTWNWGSYTGAGTGASIAGNYLGAGAWANKSTGQVGGSVGSYVPLIGQFVGTSFTAGPQGTGLWIGA